MVNPEATHEETPDDLVAASRVIFQQNLAEFPLESGKVIKIKPAKVGQLSVIMEFFNALINRVDPQQLATLVAFIAERQKAAIARGDNPYALDLRTEIATMLMEGTGVEVDSLVVAKKALGQSSMMLSMMSAVLELIPTVIPAFCNVSKEEWDDLEIDEAMVVVGSIFMVNYSFFMQRLLPVLTGFAASVIARRVQEATKVPATRSD